MWDFDNDIIVCGTLGTLLFDCDFALIVLAGDAEREAERAPPHEMAPGDVFVNKTLSRRVDPKQVFGRLCEVYGARYVVQPM